MSARLVLAFLAGTALFAVLPIFAPPIVLQADEVPRFMLGLGAALVAGAALFLAAGGSPVRRLGLVGLCALVGAALYTFAFEIPRYGIEGSWVASVSAVLLNTFFYLGLPAAFGALFAWAALTFSTLINR